MSSGGGDSVNGGGPNPPAASPRDETDFRGSPSAMATATTTTTATTNSRNRAEAVLAADHPLTVDAVAASDSAHQQQQQQQQQSKPKQEWVKFDETTEATLTTPSPSKSATNQADVAPAVLDTETVHVNTSRSEDVAPNVISSQPAAAAAASPASMVVVNNNNYGSPTQPKQRPAPTVLASIAGGPAVIEIPIAGEAHADSGDGLAGRHADSSQPGLRTIELSSGRVREGFANGDIIVTLLPVNTKWPWITPAVFRPELVPEELMAQGLTLTVEEYVHAMETLVNDYRFTLYNICYKRILCCWIIFAFSVLMGLLFSGLNGIALFSLGVGWLFLNASAIFLCMWLKLRLSRGLERCIAAVNRQLLRHKIIVVLDDRGKISCHKVNLCFMYYEPARCVKYLNDYIARSEQNGVPIEAGWEARLDVEVNDIVIQGSNTTRVSRKQARGEQLFLRYSQYWGKEFLRRRLDWIVEADGVHEMPRHMQSCLCPCQFVEQIVQHRPQPSGGGAAAGAAATTNSTNGPAACKCCLYFTMNDPVSPNNIY